MRLIAVPVDGSAFAERALPFATTIASKAGATLSLLAVHDAKLDERVFGPDVRAEQDRQSLREYLSDVADRLGTVGDKLVERHLLEGNPATAIAAWADREHPDLVCLTTHGRGPWTRLWLGSVTDRLLKTLDVPMLVIGGGLQPRSSQFGRVLVPVDLGRDVDPGQLLEPFTTLFEASFSLLYIQPRTRIIGAGLGLDAPGLSVEADQRQAAEAETRLTVMAEALRARGLKVDTQIKPGDAPAQAIAAAATEGKFDLIALTSRSPKGISRLLLGSVADKVIRAAEIPVLVLRVAQSA